MEVIGRPSIAEGRTPAGGAVGMICAAASEADEEVIGPAIVELAEDDEALGETRGPRCGRGALRLRKDIPVVKGETMDSTAAPSPACYSCEKLLRIWSP